MWAVLEICILDEDNIAAGPLHARAHCGAFAAVLFMQHYMHPAFAVQVLENRARTVLRAVIHHDDLGGKPGSPDPLEYFLDIADFVVYRDHNR